VLRPIVAFVDGDTLKSFWGCGMMAFSGSGCKNAATAVTAEDIT
jgi:hypothetical protein